MAIKVKKEIINVEDELNKYLETYGYSISLDKDKKEKTEGEKKSKDKPNLTKDK